MKCFVPVLVPGADSAGVQAATVVMNGTLAQEVLGILYLD